MGQHIFIKSRIQKLKGTSKFIRLRDQRTTLHFIKENFKKYSILFLLNYLNFTHGSARVYLSY